MSGFSLTTDQASGVAQNATTIAHLQRLSSKPGVRATLILARSDGAIISSTGLRRAPPPKESSALTAQSSPATQSNGVEASTPKASASQPASTPRGNTTSIGNATDPSTPIRTPASSAKVPPAFSTPNAKPLQSPANPLARSDPLASSPLPKDQGRGESSPSQLGTAEDLARHVFAAVHAAAALGAAGARATSEEDDEGKDGNMALLGSRQRKKAHRRPARSSHAVDESSSASAAQQTPFNSERNETDGHNDLTDPDDEVQLLRVRTADGEVVVYPGTGLGVEEALLQHS